MGCWVKQYSKGVAWYCNTSDKRVSPVMPLREALLSNLLGDHSFNQWVNYGRFVQDARLLENWGDARRKAKKYMKEHSEEEVDLLIRTSYNFEDDEQDLNKLVW